MKLFKSGVVGMLGIMSFASTGALAADRVECFETMAFGSQNVKVSETQDAVTVVLSGWNIPKVGMEILGKTVESAYSLEVSFPRDQCALSSQSATVLDCSLPSWKFPRPVIEGEFKTQDGASLGKHALGVLDIRMEKVARTSVGGDGLEFTYEGVELSGNLISEVDNAKRATFKARYRFEDCK